MATDYVANLPAMKDYRQPLQESEATQNNCIQLKTFKLRRIEPFIDRFIVKLRKNIAELRKQQDNLNKLEASQTSSAASSANDYHAALRLTSQLMAAIQQIKHVRCQVESFDLLMLDCRLTLVFNEVAQLLVDVFQTMEVKENGNVKIDSPIEMMMTADPESKSCVDGVDDDSVNLNQSSLTSNGSVGDNATTSREDLNPPTGQTRTNDQLEPCETLRQLSLQLKQKLLELNDQLQHLFMMFEHSTTDLVGASSVESAISIESSNEQHSTTTRFNVSNLKLMLIPVASAVLGGAIAGPVGLVAGLKVGKIAVVSGGLLGLTGGTMLSKQRKMALPTGNQVENEASQESAANELSETSPLMNVI